MIKQSGIECINYDMMLKGMKDFYALDPADTTMKLKLSDEVIGQAIQNYMMTSQSAKEQLEENKEKEFFEKLKKENPMETAKAISNWVGENIHQNDIDDYMLYDYKILPASEVFANSCGTLHDINNLIRVLLNMAGIHTEWTQLNGNKTSIPKANFDGMDYMVTSSQFIGVFPIGGAIDEDEYTENKIDKKLEWKPELLADGFARMNLPSDYSVIVLDASMFRWKSRLGLLKRPYLSEPSCTWFVSIFMLSYSFIKSATYFDIVIILLKHPLVFAVYIALSFFQTNNCHAVELR